MSQDSRVVERRRALGRDVLWRSVLALSAFVVLVFFLWSLRDLLNPFLLFWVLVAALAPFRGLPGHWLLVTLAGGLTLYWLLATTGSLIAPFVLAFVLAYVLDPLVDRLEKRGLGRSTAIAVLALPVLGALATVAIVGFPAVVSQLRELIASMPQLLASWRDWGIARLAVIDLPGVDEAAVSEWIQGLDGERIASMLEGQRSEIGQRVMEGIFGIGRGFGALLSILGYVFLTPVLMFYLLRDYDGIIARIHDLLPRDREPGVVEFAREYDSLLSRYLRGQLLVALILGTMTTVLLLAVQFPYALLLGSTVVVLSLVPYLGLVLSLIPAVFVAFTTGAVVSSLFKVLLIYGGTQMLEGAVISPRIVGDSVGLHPVWVVLALSVGGFFAGFVGFLIAVPVAVGVKLLVVRGVSAYRTSELYHG